MVRSDTTDAYSVAIVADVIREDDVGTRVDGEAVRESL